MTGTMKKRIWLFAKTILNVYLVSFFTSVLFFCILQPSFWLFILYLYLLYYVPLNVLCLIIAYFLGAENALKDNRLIMLMSLLPEFLSSYISKIISDFSINGLTSDQRGFITIFSTYSIITFVIIVVDTFSILSKLDNTIKSISTMMENSFFKLKRLKKKKNENIKEIHEDNNKI